MGYNESVVTSIESDGVAQLTVIISMPYEEIDSGISFCMIVNTSDGTAKGLTWSLDSDFMYPYT